jgi:hypothetical protein
MAKREPYPHRRRRSTPHSRYQRGLANEEEELANEEEELANEEEELDQT